MLFSGDILGEGALSCSDLPMYPMPISVKITLALRGIYAGEIEIGITPNSPTAIATPTMMSPYMHQVFPMVLVLVWQSPKQPSNLYRVATILWAVR